MGNHEQVMETVKRALAHIESHGVYDEHCAECLKLDGSGLAELAAANQDNRVPFHDSVSQHGVEALLALVDELRDALQTVYRIHRYRPHPNGACDCGQWVGVETLLARGAPPKERDA